MTHDELLEKVNWLEGTAVPTEFCEVELCELNLRQLTAALRAVVELHKPIEISDRGIIACDACVVTISTKINPLQDFEYTAFMDYPCKTIQAIEKKLR